MKKLFALLLTAVMLFTMGVSAAAADDSAFTAADALQAAGEKLVNADGKEVRLRGVNLGGWLIQEDWF